MRAEIILILLIIIGSLACCSCCLFYFRSCNKFFCGIKRAISLDVTYITSCTFPVLLQSAFFTKIMFASKINGKPVIKVISSVKMQNKTKNILTYLVTTGSVKLFLQIKHLNGKSSSSLSISYFLSSSSPLLSYSPVTVSLSNCHPSL